MAPVSLGTQQWCPVPTSGSDMVVMVASNEMTSWSVLALFPTLPSSSFVKPCSLVLNIDSKSYLITLYLLFL